MYLLSRRTLFPILVLLFLARPHLLAATAIEVYGLGSRAISMGGAYTAVADDFSAAYYNPAGLPQVEQVDVGVSMNFLHADFKSIRNVVIGEDAGGDPVFGDADTKIGDNGGFSGGVAVAITKRIAMGVGIYLPSNQYLARLQSQRQREPHYVMFEKRPLRFALWAGVGVEILKGLSIGAGADVLFGPQGRVKLDIPAGEEAQVDLSLTFRPRISPYAGILYKLRDDMRIGVVFREEREHGDLDIDISAELHADPIVVPIAGKMESTIFYSPRQVTLGWAWNPCQKLLVSIDLAWLQWSRFKDASIDMIVEFGGMGDHKAFEKVMAPGFEDTFLPRAGAEYLVKTWSASSWAEAMELKLRGGYFYVDSPVGVQDGLTNFMNSDSHVFSTGLGLAVLSPFGTERTINVNAHLQVHHFVDRTHTKTAEMVDVDGDGTPETRVLGYPGYVTGGNLISGGFTLGVSF